MESPKEGSWLKSVAFSPIDAMMIASGGFTGTKLYDIRQNTFR